MRALGRLMCLVVVSSGTITCLAQAQSSAPAAAPPLRAVPTAHTSAPPTRLSFDLVDPWSEEAVPAPHSRASASQLEIIIVDPWTGSERTLPAEIETIDLVDPWDDGESRKVPTASFPLLDPWQRESQK